MAKIQDANIPYLKFSEQADAPSTPATGKQLIYLKSDGKWYTKDDAGTEIKLSGSGTTLLESHEANNVSELSFVAALLSAYDVYEIDIIGLTTSVSVSAVKLQVSSDGGETWINTGYAWESIGAGGGVSVALNNDDTSIVLANWGVLTAGGNALSGSLKLFIAPGMHPRIMGQCSKMYDSGYYSEPELPHGVYKSTAAINAFRIFANSGNLLTGKIKVYGKS